MIAGRWVCFAPMGLLLVALGGCARHEAEKKDANAGPKPVVVTVSAVDARTVERTVEAVGTFKGWDEVTIGAKKMGRVVAIHHDIGDRVKPGENLVELEREDAELSVNQAEKQLLADLAKLGVEMMTIPKSLPDLSKIDINALPTVVEASVALDRARQNLTRERNLIGKGAGTRQDLENTENDVRTAEARVANTILMARSSIVGALGAKVLLDIRRQSLADMRIDVPTPSNIPADLHKPVDYVVSKRQVSDGQMLREGDAVYALVIEDPLRLYLRVPERYSSEVEPGQAVRVSVGSFPGMVFQGKVDRINPMVSSDSRSFEVEVAVPNAERKLRPGGFAKAEIVTESHAKATIVPLDSVVRYAGVTKVFLASDGKAHAQAVETGKEGPGWVEVMTALPAGAMVVTTGQSKLADGTPIVIRDRTIAAPEASPGEGPKAGGGPSPAAAAAEPASPGKTAAVEPSRGS